MHRLQARTKVLVLVWLVITLLIANQHQGHFAPYIVALLIIGGEIALSGISLRVLWERLWLLVVLIFTSTLFSLFAGYRSSPALLTLGPWLPRYGSVRDILLVIGVICLALILSSLLPGVRLLWQRKWLKWMRAPLWLIMIVIVLFCWLTIDYPVNKPLTFGPLVITYRNVWVMIVSFVVFLTLYISSLLLTMTTMPVALIEGVTLLLSPLRRLKLPVDDFALMILLALRFIPTLLEETEQLIKAQSARGAELLQGSFRERLQSLSMFFLPLVQGALRRASDLAVALEARGYRSEGKQTFLHETSLAYLDYIVMGSVLFLTVASLML